MTQEDINEVVTKSMPQWKKDQFDAIYANADYIEWLRRKIERREEKLKSHNKDYAELEKQRDDLLNTLNTVIVHYNSLEHEDDPSADYDVESAQQLLARIKEGE